MHKPLPAVNISPAALVYRLDIELEAELADLAAPEALTGFDKSVEVAS